MNLVRERISPLSEVNLINKKTMNKMKVLEPVVAGDGVKSVVPAYDKDERKAFLEGKLVDLQQRIQTVKAELKELNE